MSDLVEIRKFLMAEWDRKEKVSDRALVRCDACDRAVELMKDADVAEDVIQVVEEYLFSTRIGYSMVETDIEIIKDDLQEVDEGRVPIRFKENTK